MVIINICQEALSKIFVLKPKALFMKQKKILFDIENFNQMGRKVGMLMGKDKKNEQINAKKKKSFFNNCSKKTFFKN